MALLSQQPIGESPEFHALMDRVSDIASLDRATLLVGERGTGKELIASRLHFLSPRWEQDYVSLNCAAYTEEELEAHLFGRDGYNGRAGIESVFLRANGGTLFLDHIEECSPRIQEKLLQTLELGAVTAIDESEAVDFDVRLLSATSIDLPEAAAIGTFRQDLTDIIAFHVLGLPALRDRPEDIVALTQHFGRKIISSLGAERFSGFTAEAMGALMRQNWPGNVRELKLAVERSVAQAYLKDESLSLPIAELVLDPFAGTAKPPMPPASSAGESTELQHKPDITETTDFTARVMIFERGLIDEALQRSQGHQGRAADNLGLSYHQFRGLLRKHGLKK